MRWANGIKLGNIANKKSEYHMGGKKKKTNEIGEIEMEWNSSK